MNRMISGAFALMTLVVASAVPTSAQVPTGTEFIVALPPVMSYAERNDTSFKFHLEVLCSRQTTVSVKWATPGGGYLVYNAIVQGGSRLYVSQPMFKMQDFIQQDSRDSTTRANYRAFIVTADHPVTVQGTFDRNYRAESFMVMPTKAYDTAYTIVTYSGHGTQSRRNGFIVTASEDSTLVRIKPTADIYNGTQKGNAFTISLMRGQVYEVLSNDQGLGVFNDLTGTTVTSNRPIGVTDFSYTDVPVMNPPTDPMQPFPEAYYRAKTLIEQQFPNSSGDTLFRTLPFARQSDSYVRVMTLFPYTSLWINDTMRGSAKLAGTSFEVRISSATTVRTDKPVIAMQFAESSDLSTIDSLVHRSGGQSDTLVKLAYGDPMMVALAPQKVYKPALQWSSPLLDERPSMVGSPPAAFYWMHYAMITAPTSASSSVRLDGNPVNFTTTYPDGEYVAAIVHVSPSQHLIEADAPVSVLSYGFTGNDSYGMTTGEALRSIAALPLDTLRAVACSNSFDTTLVIHNQGNNAFEIDSVTATGIPYRVLVPASFPWEVAAGDSAYIAVSFTMSQPGRYSGTLTIATDAHNRRLFPIPLSITRDSAALGYPSTVDFSLLGSSQSMRDSSISVSNDGTRPLVITGVQFAGVGFSLDRSGISRYDRAGCHRFAGDPLRAPTRWIIRGADVDPGVPPASRPPPSRCSDPRGRAHRSWCVARSTSPPIRAIGALPRPSIR